MIVDDELINKGGTKKYDTKHRNFLCRRGKFIDYYSENDFEYTVHFGQKCKVLKNGKYFAGTLCDVNPDESTFSIKLSNEEIMEISCGDIEEFLGEEELEF